MILLPLGVALPLDSRLTVPEPPVMTNVVVPPPLELIDRCSVEIVGVGFD